jgi:bacterioferritin-associated ferredoxin
MRDCPSKPVLVVRDDGEYSYASDFDENTLALLADDHEGNDDHPEEHVGTGDADHNESLIVHRVLSTQMERVEQNQRHTLFQTKCGSCNNLASSDMVDKLALTTKPHPHPYHIQRLNNSGKAKVTKLVRLNFSTSPYHDVVECEVVPMQACHILLGRPWQLDKDSMHHGRLNQYSFLHHDKKIVLHPMSPEAIMNNDVAAARKTKSHDHAEITNHIAAKDGVKHEKTHTNSQIWY